MKNRRHVYLFIITILFIVRSNAQVPERTGLWKFDDGTQLNKATKGIDLTLQGTEQAAGGPEEGNGAVLIGPGSYYRMKHMIPANGGGKHVNEFTLQFDFKVPGISVWHSFFQTNLNNSNDGDFFINPSGNIGVAAVGYTSFTINQQEWYRLVVSVKNGSFFKVYLEGNPIMTGTIQPVDGRFSLDSMLLVFADENGEDGDIYCSELAIWDRALTSAEIKELGGFEHNTQPPLMTRIPYLQAPGQHSMVICWHDTCSSGTRVEYGIDSSLNMSATGSSELISEPYRWHTVKLTGLVPGTRYFYRVSSGSGSSAIYAFKTPPDSSYKGKLRFILLSDTHSPDTTKAGELLRAARAKITELYGPDIENHVNGIFHSGDITMSGNSPGEYTMEYFQPMSSLSASIPVMVVAGNHEGESPYFYEYLKLDDLSVFPSSAGLNEKIWQFRSGNTLFIGLNTNIIGQYGKYMANWLDTRLNEAEQDQGIDFVFLFFHHPPFSELWFDVSTFDGGANYVRDVLFPVFKKYTKVQQICTGHTHGFERGTIMSPARDGDFRIVCGGGGGGALDSWGAFTNYDYNDIHIAIDNYFFQVLEIDIAGKSWKDTMYSIGDMHRSRNSEAMDSWYRNSGQPGPETPAIENIEVTEETIKPVLSEFIGTDSLMSVEIQVIDGSEEGPVVMDSLVHWTDIYGVDENYNPVDRHAGINLYKPVINTSLLPGKKEYCMRVRYRDHNLKWSGWSEAYSFRMIGTLVETTEVKDFFLGQNYPNPFSYSTTFPYQVNKTGNVGFRLMDVTGKTVETMDEGNKTPGEYILQYNTEKLKPGMYYIQLLNENRISTRKMVVK